MSKKMWCKEAIIKDASKYKTLAEWRTASPSAYTICCRNKWNEEACAHMASLKKANGFWTPERILQEAKKYKTTGEWHRSDSKSYAVAKKLGLIPENMKRELIHGQWTKAKIAEVAIQCDTRGEFRSTFPSAYTIAAQKGWIDDVCVHMLNKAPWFGPRVIREFLMRHDVKHQMEHKFKNHPDVARYPFDFFLPAFNLVIEYHGKQHKEGWRRDPESAKAIQERDRIKKEFAMHAGINYLEIEANTKQEIVNELISKLTSIKRDQNEQVNLIERELTESELKTLKTAFLWNEESVREAVSQCKTIKELRERFPSVRGYAKTHGILAEITNTLVRVSERGKYTKEYVSEMASQCQTRKEFRERYKACWSAAQRNVWIAEVCQHMPKHLQKPWLG